MPSLRKDGTIEIRSSGSTLSITTSPPVTAARPAKLADLDVIRADAVGAAAEPLDTLDVEDVRADPLDRRAETDEEAAEILDVRLAGGVPDDRLALGEDRRHDRVLGAHHRGLVEVQARAPRPRRAHVVAAVQLERRHRARRRRGCACRDGGGRSRPRPAAASPRARSARAAARRAGTRRGSRVRDRRRARSCRTPGRIDPHLVRRRSSDASAPMSARSSTIVSTSRMRGTFVSVTGSDASTVAARIGSAPFLFPAARTVPESGRPPSMTNDCMRRAVS